MNMNDEVICGYLVTAEQKRKNAVYLDLLAEFARLCKAADVTWWVFFGSLLGAVRHKGFIPWDDDIDLAVPRKDFDRLMAMTNEEFGAKAPYFLQNPVNDPACVEVLLRFRRSDTAFIVNWNWREILQQPEGCPYDLGMGLTIFPLDELPRGRVLPALQCRAAGFMVNILYRAYSPAGQGRELRRHIARGLARLTGRLGLSRLCSFPYRMVRKNRSGKVQILSGRVMDYDSNTVQETVYDAADFARTAYVPFEGVEVPIPAGYDHILRSTYGNYMEFPPEGHRQPLHDAVADPGTPYPVVVERMRAGEIPLPDCWEI